MAAILNRTPLGATAWLDSASDTYQSRLFWQNVEGDVRMSSWDSSSQTWTTDAQKVGKAKLNTPIEAVSWAEGEHLQVYTKSAEDSIQQWVFDQATQTWNDGVLTDAFGDLVKSGNAPPMANYSQIGVMTTGDWYEDPENRDIHVFYQGFDNQIKEVYINGTANVWAHRENNLVTATPGSSIAVSGIQSAITDPEEQYQGYTIILQEDDMRLISMLNKNYTGTEWEYGLFSQHEDPASYFPTCAISAAGYFGDDDHFRHIFAISDVNDLMFSFGQGNFKNNTPPTIEPSKPIGEKTISFAPVEAAQVNAKFFQIFTQTESQAIDVFTSTEHFQEGTWEVVKDAVPVPRN